MNVPDRSEPSIEDRQRPADSILDTLKRDSDQRREAAAAFAAENAKRPSIHELLRSHQQQSQRMAQLDRTVRRLQRRFWYMTLVGLLIAAVAASFLVSQYQTLRSHALLTQSVDGKSGGELTSNPSVDVPAIANVIAENQMEFKIRNDTDHKYQIVVRELYMRATMLRRPVGSIEKQNVAVNEYIRFTTDLWKAIEQASQDHPSPEIMVALCNLSVIARERRRVDHSADLGIETRNKMDQVRIVLRAPDVRMQPHQEGISGGQP